MERNKQKTIAFQDSYSVTDERGTNYKATTKRAVIGTEDDYIKIYFQGLEYIRDMPRDCFALLCILMKYASYADKRSQDGENYSFVMHVDKYVKKEIAKKLGYKSIRSISNLMTQLIDGGVIARMTNSVYRLNPYYFGKGKFENIVDLRNERDGFLYPAEGDTFMTAYKRNYGTRRHKAERRKAKDLEELEAIDKKWKEYIGPQPKFDPFKR